MPSHAQMKQLRGARRVPETGTADFKRTIAGDLASAGVPVTLEDGEHAGPHTLLAVLEDRGGRARLYCIPDANLPADDRAAIERVSGRCFASHFTADLMPEQFTGALLVLVRTRLLEVGGPGDGIHDAIAEELAADGVAMPALDWEHVAGDVWGGVEVRDRIPPIALTHFYCVHIAE